MRRKFDRKPEAVLQTLQLNTQISRPLRDRTSNLQANWNRQEA